MFEGILSCLMKFSTERGFTKDHRPSASIIMHQQEKDGPASRKEISIETLSTPPIQIVPASLLRRTIACAIDSLIIALAWVIPIAAGQVPDGLLLTMNLTMMSPFALAYLMILTFAYYFFLEGIFASTVGKSLLRLRVLGKDGDPCSVGASFKRNLFRFLDWLPFLYVVGAISIVISRERQRVGDRAAGTMVTSVPEKDINPPPAPFLFH